MKKQIKRIIALASVLVFCVAISVSALAAEIQPRAQVCPSCGKGTLIVTIEYDGWSTTGGSRICQHGHAKYADVTCKRERMNHYKCSSCGLDEVFSSGAYQTGWKCEYNGKYYPN